MAGQIIIVWHRMSVLLHSLLVDVVIEFYFIDQL